MSADAITRSGGATAADVLADALKIAHKQTTELTVDDLPLPSAPITEPAEGVSEAAELVASLIPVLPDETVLDLGRLLQRHLTTFSSQATRYARLGLLIDLVSDGSGVVPTTREYEAARAERAALGETDWPAHSSLHAAYGTWTKAVRAAMLLWRDGTGARVPASNHHHEFRGMYSHDEAIGALQACRDAIGDSPTEGEYREWRQTARELARNAGVPYARHPSGPAWRRLFGTWTQFLAAAQRSAASRPTSGR
jgi:hypothetical protein